MLTTDRQTWSLEYSDSPTEGSVISSNIIIIITKKFQKNRGVKTKGVKTVDLEVINSDYNQIKILQIVRFVCTLQKELQPEKGTNSHTHHA